MNLRFLESFVVTADLGSFSRAAESLYVTPAAVAARVAKLEEDLGAVLFVRDGTALRLTEQGRRVLHHGRQLVGQADAFLKQVREPGLTTGTLRIGWTGFVSHLLQPEFTRVLRQRYPCLNLEFQTLSSLDVMEGLAEGRIDLAVSVGAHASRHWVDVPLFSLPMRWMCSAALFGAGLPSTFAELMQMPVITYPVGTIPYQAIIQQLEGEGQSLPPLYSSSTVWETLAMACAGIGSTVMPPVIVRQQLDAGSLVTIDLPPPARALDFHASYRAHSEGSLSAEVCSLIRELAHRCLSGISADR